MDRENLEQAVGHIYRCGANLRNMIDGLLNLSRVGIGTLNLFFEPIQPAPFLQELFIGFAKSETNASNVKWVLDIPDRLPIIRADIVRLRQVLINLLANAAKYTKQGIITLGAEVELPYLHL